MNVYIYHIPELNAVKIGKGWDPTARMLDYARFHGFNPDQRSLRHYHIGNDAASLDLEQILHANIGLKKLRWGTATEIFSLGRRSYTDVLTRFSQVIRQYNGVSATELDKNSLEWKVVAFIFSAAALGIVVLFMEHSYDLGTITKMLAILVPSLALLGTALHMKGKQPRRPSRVNTGWVMNLSLIALLGFLNGGKRGRKSI